MSETSGILLSRGANSFLLCVCTANLVLGILFYAIPDAIIPYWPWPVKELAVRFLGAIFLAISLGCWSASQAKLWQRAKILVLVGGTFFILTAIVSVTTGLGASTWTIEWAGLLFVEGIGCFILLKMYRWRRKQNENGKTAVSLPIVRLFFGVQTTVVGVFGAMMLLTPSLAQQQFWPWRVAIPTLQTFGALFLATCLATGWAFFQRDSERIRVLLPLDAVFPSLALLAVSISWNVIATESPSWMVTAVWIFLYSFVALGSTLLYFKLMR